MLLNDFLIAQTAGASAVSWVAGKPGTATPPQLDGVEVRDDTAVAPHTAALPVVIVRQAEIDDVLGQIEGRPESSRLVVLTDLFLFEPEAEKLVTTLALVGCQLLHAVEIDDAAELDVFGALALQRRSVPLRSAGRSALDLVTAGLETLHRSAQGTADVLDRLRALSKDRDRTRRDLRSADDELRALRASTAMQVGRAAVDALRIPRTGLRRLPRRLLAAWRTRPGRRAVDETNGNAAGGAAAAPRLDFSLPLPLPPESSEHQPRRELTFRVPTSLYVARVLQQDGLGAFEPDMLPWFLALCEAAHPGAVWDVGANIGVYGLLARTYTNREVVGFEPTPEISAWARRIAADNDLTYRLEQFAAGEVAGSARLYLSDRTDSSNSLAKGFRPSSRDVEVLVESLDRYQELTNGRPAIVKIDTETTEHLVLRGARRVLAEYRPWVFCEVLVNREPARVLTEIMGGTGYRYYQLTGDRSPVERQTITGDLSNPHPNYLFAPTEPDHDLLAAVEGWRRALADCPAPA
ncbi:MAG: FkbM family methyltransferase [Jiangellaceae bacterium]